MTVLILSFIFVLLFFIMFVTQKGKSKTAMSLVFAFLFIVSLVLSISNEDFHFGMKKVTVTTKTSLVSAVPAKGMDMLLYQPLGTKGEKIYLYRTSENQKKPKQSRADINVNNRVESGSKKAQLIQKTTVWDYQNKWMRFLFKMPNDEREVIKVENIYQLPSSWLVLSTKQARQLQETMKKQAPEMKKEAKSYVQDKIKEEMMNAAKKGKKLSKTEIQKLTKQYAQSFQQEKVKQIVSQLQQ